MTHSEPHLIYICNSFVPTPIDIPSTPCPPLHITPLYTLHTIILPTPVAYLGFHIKMGKFLLATSAYTNEGPNHVFIFFLEAKKFVKGAMVQCLLNSMQLPCSPLPCSPLPRFTSPYTHLYPHFHAPLAKKHQGRS